MTRRRLVWAAVGLVALGLLTGGWAALGLVRSPGRVTYATYERVQPGMTEQQVEKLLGEATSIYESGQPEVPVWKSYEGREGWVQVQYGPDGHVSGARFDLTKLAAYRPSLGERLRQLLGF